MENKKSLISDSISYAKQADFIGQDILLKEARIPKLMKSVVILSLLIILTIISWMYMSTVTEVVPSTGVVTKTNDTKTISHKRGGLVNSVNIKSGQHVHEGEILVSLLDESIIDVKDELLTQVFHLSVERDQLFADGYNKNKDRIMEIEQTVDQIDFEIRRTEEEIESLNIRAPFNGVVSNLNVNTTGEYLAMGQAILDLTPIGVKAKVEVKIKQHDFDKIKIGSPVALYFKAINFYKDSSTYGFINTIEPEVIYTVEGVPYYTAVVEVDKNYIGKRDDFRLILPGMDVKAEIITSEETLLTYLMKPINISQEQKLTER